MKTLDTLNENEQEQLFAVIADCMEQIDNGARIDRRKIMWQHPEFAEALDDFFESSDLVDQMAGPTLQESIAKTPTHSEAMLDTTSPTGGRTIGDRQQSLPEEFGRYRIIRKLGEGAMGAVYLAFDNQLEREVALKTPSFDNDATGELLERFYREAKSAGLLRHPGICPVHDVGKIDGIHYISMAYIEGRTLSSYIKAEKPQDERTIALLIRKLALALDEAHQKGVTHRDLKPANIMIDHRSVPVVMDFGLAYQAGIGDELCRTAAAAVDDAESARQTRPNTILGSPAYMSPEQVESRLDDIGPATDIYCLGVVLYELLTGQLPYNGSLAIVLAQIVGVDPESPSTHRPGLDRRLEKICLKMMSKRIEDRYESMGDVAKALTRVIKHPKSDVTQPALPQPSRLRSAATQTARKLLGPLAGSRKAAALFVASIVVPLLVLGGVVLLFQFRDATVRLEVGDPKVRVFVAGSADSKPHKGGETITIKPGNKQLSIQYGGVAFNTDEFMLDRGSNPAIRVELVDKNKLVAWHGERVILEKVIRQEIPAPDGAPAPAVAPFNAEQAKRHQQAWADNLGVPVETTNSIGMKVRLIPPGEFLMGSSDKEFAKLIVEAKEKGLPDYVTKLFPGETPQHKVVLTQPYGMSIHEVTRGQFRQFVEATGYKTDAERDGKGGYGWQVGKKLQSPAFLWNTKLGFDTEQTEDHPVVNVSWNDAVAFCQWLSKKEGVTHRLPTEAEWEFACRAGSLERFCCGNQEVMLKNHAWYSRGGGIKTYRVGIKRPNTFGLFDLHGNVWEWCDDCYDQYPAERVVDPVVQSNKQRRVKRGGHFAAGTICVRSACRWPCFPSERNDHSGFRTVRDFTRRATTTPAHAPLNQITAVRTFEGHEDRATSVVVSADNRYVLSGGWPVTLKLWDFKTGALLHDFKRRVSGFDFAADGRTVVMTDTDQTILLWDSATRQPLQSLQVAKAYSVRCSPDGERVVCCCHDSTVRVLNVKSGMEEHKFKAEIKGGAGSIVEFTPDGQSVVVARHGPPGPVHVNLFNLTTGMDRTFDIDNRVSTGFDLAPDGRFALVSMYGTPSVARLDMETGQVVNFFARHESTCYCVKFLGDGRYAATAGRDNAIHVWDTVTGRKVARSPTHPHHLSDLKVTADGRGVLACIGWASDQSAPKQRLSKQDLALRLWQLPKSVWPQDTALAVADTPPTNANPPNAGDDVKPRPGPKKPTQPLPEIPLPGDIMTTLPLIGVQAPVFIADEFLRGLVGIIAQRQQQLPKGSSPKSNPKSSKSKQETGPVLKAANYLMLAKILMNNDKRNDAKKWVRRANEEYNDCPGLLQALIKEHDGKPLAKQARDVLALVKEVNAEKKSK